MEIGSLAEWVESFAEILAVSVALFLPYYQKRKANKEKISRQNRSSLKLRISFYLKQNSRVASIRRTNKICSIYLV
jgi:hypothetical protein